MNNNFVSFDLIQIPKRSLPSTQLTAYCAHACKSFSATVDPFSKVKQLEQSRTQHKLMLQRQSFLADDKDNLEYPENMRRLTKELDRMNREYKYLKQYHDPFISSLQRVKALQQPNLQRRASYHTVQEYFQQRRRHSLPHSHHFISRIFSSSPLSQ